MKVVSHFDTKINSVWIALVAVLQNNCNTKQRVKLTICGKNGCKTCNFGRNLAWLGSGFESIDFTTQWRLIDHSLDEFIHVTFSNVLGKKNFVVFAVEFKFFFSCLTFVWLWMKRVWIFWFFVVNLGKHLYQSKLCALIFRLNF